MPLHTAHIATIVFLLIAFALGAASLGLSFVHLKGTTDSPSPYAYFTSYGTELLPFKQCTDTVGVSASYTTSQCLSWDSYFPSSDRSAKYCPTIGTTGNITQGDMLNKVQTAGVTGGVYVASVLMHLVLFVLWAAALIPTRFALLPAVLIAFITWIICLVFWAQLYFACDKSYCEATQFLLSDQLTLNSTECFLADGFRTLIASFGIFLGCLVPVFVCSPPQAQPPADLDATPEVVEATSDPDKVMVVEQPTKEV